MKLEIHGLNQMKDHRFSLVEGKHYILGRGKDCDFTVKDPRLSRHHCRIIFNHGKVVIEDMGSKNGTKVNGKKIAQQALIKGGDQLAFSEAGIFRLVDLADPNRENELDSLTVDSLNVEEKRMSPIPKVEHAAKEIKSEKAADHVKQEEKLELPLKTSLWSSKKNMKAVMILSLANAFLVLIYWFIRS